MAYTLSTLISLGKSKVSLSLSAQLFDTNGSNIGSYITSGFVEIGQGNYLWTYNGFPSGFRGGVKFFSQADYSTVLAASPINPEDAEYINSIYETVRSQKQIEIISTSSPIDIRSGIRWIEKFS